MNLGILATLGNQNPSNLLTLIFDNASYESSGGFATHTGRATDLASIASGAGIERAFSISDVGEFEKALDEAMGLQEQTVIVAVVEKGTKMSPLRETDGIEDKYNFIRAIEKQESTRILPRLPRKKYDVEFG